MLIVNKNRVYYFAEMCFFKKWYEEELSQEKRE
jgi:hypothetical protein